MSFVSELVGDRCSDRGLVGRHRVADDRGRHTVFPQFSLPAWSVRAVIVVVVLGLPVADAGLVVRPDRAGLRREDEAAARRPPPAGHASGGSRRSGSHWHSARVSLRARSRPGSGWCARRGGRPVIAVLPFANLSPDPENAYFADGLHEEVLATLARAGGLRVISRTSVQEFRDSKRNLKEIADALGVADPRRFRAPLGRRPAPDAAADRRPHRRAPLDRHLRSQVPRLTAIAKDRRRTGRSGHRRHAVARRTTTHQDVAPTVPEAYDSYLHALALTDQYATAAEIGVVLALLDRSIGLDPGFAPAHAFRAKARVWSVRYAADDTT